MKTLNALKLKIMVRAFKIRLKNGEELRILQLTIQRSQRTTLSQSMRHWKSNGIRHNDNPGID